MIFPARPIYPIHSAHIPFRRRSVLRRAGTLDAGGFKITSEHHIEIKQATKASPVSGGGSGA
ncbi:hypothetical protein ARTHROSP310_37680 [Arthrobacter sp. AD-310]